MKTTTNITYPAFALLAFACFAFLPVARALSPTPDGCYPNNTTAEGCDALDLLTTGSGNTALGADTLVQTTTGSNNTATGWQALSVNTTGHDNTGDGVGALEDNTTGSNNVANGSNALLSNTTGSFNAVNGVGALKVSNGSNNTADGYRALFKNTTGNNNIAIGSTAGTNLTTGSNNIDIGALGVAGEANTMRLGTSGTQTNTYIAGINGVTVAGGIGVIVDSSGHLGTSTSSARYKENIQPMDKASEAILSLHPVTFRYKKELDPKAIPQFGLVAEQVEKVDSDLVARDNQGKPYSVRYEAVNAMLLNEFLKEHKAFVDEQRKVQELETNAVHQQKQIEALTAIVQKVSAQLEVKQTAPQRVVNNDW